MKAKYLLDAGWAVAAGTERTSRLGVQTPNWAGDEFVWPASFASRLEGIPCQRQLSDSVPLPEPVGNPPVPSPVTRWLFNLPVSPLRWVSAYIPRRA